MSTEMVLLGIADRVNAPKISDPANGLNIYGLRQTVVSSIYPIDIGNFVFVLALRAKPELQGRFCLRNDINQYEIIADFEMKVSGTGNDVYGRWLVMGFPLKQNGFRTIVFEPCELFVHFIQGEAVQELGAIRFIYHQAPALTIEQQRAIASNPALNRIFCYKIECKHCQDRITPWTAIDRSKVQIPDTVVNPVWYQELPDRFTCSCQGLSLPLRYIRESFHCSLSRYNNILPDGSTATTSTISMADTERILFEFTRLLQENPDEEDVQKFIETNLLMLAPFGATQVFLKPPILSKYKADFGIINSKNELLLIEIERPSIKLLKMDGTQAAELTHALEQTLEWEHEITQHRAAVLANIPNCPSDVTAIRYIVIAGRSESCDEHALQRLVRQKPFMTYDHLIRAVHDTVRLVVT